MKNTKSILSLILFTQLVFSQGKAGSIFLSINPGARANGMGEANIAIADDSYATYYNPAGLINLSSSNFSFMHTSYLPNLADDMSYDFLSYGSSFRENSSIGGHFTYLNLGDQISTDTDGNTTGSFSSYMYALGLSYAQKINESSSWGVTGKYFYQELAVINSLDASSSNFAIDLGYHAKGFMENPNLNFGAVLSNIGPGVSFADGEEDPLPTKIGLGLAMMTLENKGLVAFDLNYELNDQTMVTNLGLEYSVNDNFRLRGGFISDPSGDLNYTTLGMGAILDGFGFDLSYIIGDDLDPHSDMLRFSLNGYF